MEPRMSKKEEKSLYILGWMLLAAAVLLLGITKGLHMQMKIFSLPCVFRELTGYYCPGCGGHQGLRCPSAGKNREILSLPSCGAVHGCHLWLVHDHTYNRISDQGKAGGGDAVPRPVSLFSSRHHTDTVGSAESPETDMGN